MRSVKTNFAFLQSTYILTTCGIPPGGIPAGRGIIPACIGGIPVLTDIGTEGTVGGIPDIGGGGMPPCTTIWGIMLILGNIPWGIIPKRTM